MVPFTVEKVRPQSVPSANDWRTQTELVDQDPRDDRGLALPQALSQGGRSSDPRRSAIPA